MDFLATMDMIDELGLSPEGAQAIYDGLTRSKRMEDNKRWGLDRIESLSNYYHHLMTGSAKSEAWQELIITSTLSLNSQEGKSSYSYQAWQTMLEVINELRKAGMPPNSLTLRSVLTSARARQFRYTWEA